MAPMLKASAEAVWSSGASQIAMMSNWPSVQYTSLTVTPTFLAISLKASARLVVSLALRMPWSVKQPSTTNVAMAFLLVADPPSPRGSEHSNNRTSWHGTRPPGGMLDVTRACRDGGGHTLPIWSIDADGRRGELACRGFLHRIVEDDGRNDCDRSEERRV